MKRILTAMLIVLLAVSCNRNEYQCPAGSPNIVGAKCNDGTRSSATGSGACSSHGGVKHWICED